MKKFLFLFGFVFVLTGVANSQELAVKANLDSLIPQDSNIIKGKFENGLTYYIRKNSKPEKRAELRLVVKAGSILEDDDQLGLAHFMEHMEFNGTKNFKKNELVSYLQSIGVKFGADLNAYTSFDETVYILPVPTDDPKILSQSFQILEDWAHNATLDHEEIDKERGVVIEEWRTGRGANQRMRDKNLPVLLKGSRYAKRLPIGTLENLQNFKYETLERFYKTWYRPDLMAVIAVGDFDASDIKARIEKHFGQLQNPENEVPRKLFTIPNHEERLVTIASDKEATFSTVSYYIKNELKKETYQKDFYQGLLDIFYTGMLNQRLQELTQQPVPPFIYAGTSYGKFIDHKASFIAMANVKEGDILKGLASILTECERVRRYGFTKAELKRFAKNFLRFYEQAYDERAKTPSRSYAQEYIRNFLEDEPIPGIEFEYAFAKKYMDQISVEEINALSAGYFRHDNQVIEVQAPDKEDISLPEPAQLLAVADSVANMHISPYIDKIGGTKLMESLPAPGSIASEKVIPSVGVTELVLSNGARVILKPTDFKDDEVMMTAWSDGGNSIYPDSDYQSASNADAIVNACGVAHFSPTDLQKVLAGKDANVRPFIGTLSEGMNGSCSLKDMETMFQLMHLYFSSPNQDKDLFQSYINKSKALYKNLLSSPNYYFYNESTKILTQNHPRGGQFPTESDWDKIDFERTFQIYRERFANAADFTFVFVGSFQVDSIKNQLSRYVASLPSTANKDTWRDLGIRPPEGVVKQDIIKGTDPKSTVAIRFHNKYKFDRRTNHLLNTLADVLNIELIKKVREEKSGVYGISAKASMAKNPYEHYTFLINFPCKPDNADTLTDVVYRVIKDIQSNGVSDATFQKVIETQKRDMEVKIKENGYWMSSLKYSYVYGYDPADIINYKKRINAVTMADLQNTAKKYLNFHELIYLRLLPEK